ncbi:MULTISPECIES: transposase [unclassified Vibrio]|uniref:Transposase n=1 Tax=Vibrio sp. HB236076 TaxID=3232307 RepID=A0AB39HKH7_9VIBR|nr:transposase [Vibrio sp. HB161653]MDP5253063.1 transposase [Vibrio sp. HB161653]
MTQARSSLISLQDTPYYHCISRCVRKAYLCGEDQQSGQCFDHRKIWLIERIRLLSQVFSIDICAYAIMSNHYHLVLHVDEKKAKGWSNYQVIQRWTKLYRPLPLIERYSNNELTEKPEIDCAEKIIHQWRERLMDISWFMKNLNEYIARQANKEDQCTGRFWEGRFKSQALLDERALLSCMAYVDLNPVHSGLVNRLEDSEFTSIYERLHGYACKQDSGRGQVQSLARTKLFGFLGNQRAKQPCKGLAFSLLDYFEMVDVLGHAIRPDKCGSLLVSPCTLLQELQLDSDEWLTISAQFGRHFTCAVGGINELRYFAQHTRRAWVRQVRIR